MVIKRLVIFIAFFSILPLHAEGLRKNPPLSINVFRGLDVDDPALSLQPGFSPNSHDVLTDQYAGLAPRLGYVQISTQTADQVFEFPTVSGLRYLVARQGGNLVADNGAGTFKTYISTVSAAVQSACSPFGNYFYCTNTVDGLHQWNPTGNTWTVISDTNSIAPSANGTQLVTWQGRLALAGVVGYERYLFLSALGDGTTWSTPTYPSNASATTLIVQGALDEPISALYSSYLSNLVIMTAHSFQWLLGQNFSNFSLYTISNRFGTNNPDSIQDCDGYLRWLGPQNAFYQFDGVNLTKISGPHAIDSLMSQVVQGNGTQKTYKFNTGQGTNIYTDTTTLNGTVIVSTQPIAVFTDSTTANFQAGTLTNVVAATNTVFLPGVFPTSLAPNSQACGCGSDFMYYPYSVVSSTGGILASGSFMAGNGNYNTSVPRSIDSSAWIGTPIKLGIGPVYPIFTVTFVDNANTITWNDTAQCISATCYGSNEVTTVSVSSIQNGPSPSSGTFLSQVFDTKVSSPAWQSSSNFNSNIGIDCSTTTPNCEGAFYTQVSTSPTGPWDSPQLWLSTGSILSASKRYIQYEVQFSTFSGQTEQLSVSSVTINAQSSTGTYITNSVQMLGATSWGFFGVLDYYNNGQITYGLYTSSWTANASLSVFTASQTITNNSLPSIGISSYTWATANFALTNPPLASPAPNVNILQITWNSGSILPVESGWSNQRLWEFVAIGSTSNNIALIYDRNHDWQEYTNMPGESVKMYNGNLVMAGAKGIFQLEVGNNDNGAAINSLYTTKRLNFMPGVGGTEFYGELKDLYLTTTNSASSLNINFDVNGQTTNPYSLGAVPMNQMTGDQSLYVPFTYTLPKQARSLDLIFSVSSSVNWNLISADLETETEMKASP